jgi:hypothetical protein
LKKSGIFADVSFKYLSQDIHIQIFMDEYCLYPLYESKPLIPSKSAQYEMDKFRLDLWFVKRVLEEGFDCAVGRRKQNIIERCIRRKGKIIKVVVAKVEWEDKAFWRIIHVGQTTQHR